MRGLLKHGCVIACVGAAVSGMQIPRTKRRDLDESAHSTRARAHTRARARSHVCTHVRIGFPAVICGSPFFTLWWGYSYTVCDNLEPLSIADPLKP